MNKPPGGMRTFTIIWFGQLISALGSGLSGFALGVWVYERTGSATAFSVIVLAFMVPSVLFSPVAGALVDRWNRRLILIACDAISAASTLTILILLLSNSLEIWHLYILIFVSAIAGSFQWPAMSTATTMLVPQEDLGRAGGMTQIGESISTLLSPALAGYLFLSIGLNGIFVIDLLTFLVAVATLLVVSIPEPERTNVVEEETTPSLWKEIRYGWDYILDRRGLLLLLIYIATINLGFGFTDPLYTPLFLSLGNAQQAGIAFSVLGLGSVVGTILMSVWGGPRKRIYGVLISGFWLGIAYIVFGLRPWLWLVAVAGFVRNLILLIMLGASQALWQAKTAPDVQGRVFSVRRFIAWCTAPISTLIAGPLVDRVLQPGMEAGGSLAASFGAVIGVGPGRGSALVFSLVGVFVSLVTLAFFAVPKLRNVDTDIQNVEIKVRPTRADANL